MTPVDLEPATRTMSGLLAGVPDELLGAPTPCPAYTLGDLIDHVLVGVRAFTDAARKTPGSGTAPPSADASRLGDDWRTRMPGELETLAEAWRDPAAWTGMTRAGGVELPGEVAGVVALDELVIHGWDIARASGQPFDYDPELLDVVHGFVAESQASEREGPEGRLFGPAVEVPDDAPLLDRVIGLSGRDPGWSPAQTR